VVVDAQELFSMGDLIRYANEITQTIKDEDKMFLNMFTKIVSERVLSP